MYEELVAKLRYCNSTATCRDCPYMHGACDDMKKEAADAIEELLSERDEVNANSWKTALEVERDEHRWISVEERLPEPYVEVLLYSGGDRYTGYMHNDKRFTVNASHYPDRPTHWAHLLPEPPKEDV